MWYGEHAVDDSGVRCYSGDKLMCIGSDIRNFYLQRSSLCESIFMGETLCHNQSSP